MRVINRLMKRTFLILNFCLLYACIALAQEDVKFNKELKVNFPFQVAAGRWQPESLAAVLILETKRKNRHEFELGRFGFSRRGDQETDRHGQEYLIHRADHGLRLRYQYSFSFLPEARFSPFLAGSVQSRWSYYSFASERRPSFRYFHHSNVNIAALVPGARWRINERIGIDYGLEINLLQYNFQYSQIRSLGLGNYYYGTYSLRSEPFSAFRSRIGLYVKL